MSYTLKYREKALQAVVNSLFYVYVIDCSYVLRIYLEIVLKTFVSNDFLQNVQMISRI